MKTQVIDDVLNKNLSVRTIKIDSNNIMTTEEVCVDSNNDNNNMGFILVPKQENGIDEECKEICSTNECNNRINNKSNRVWPRILTDYNAERC